MLRRDAVEILERHDHTSGKDHRHADDPRDPQRRSVTEGEKRDLRTERGQQYRQRPRHGIDQGNIGDPVAEGEGGIADHTAETAQHDKQPEFRRQQREIHPRTQRKGQGDGKTAERDQQKKCHAAPLLLAEKMPARMKKNGGKDQKKYGRCHVTLPVCVYTRKLRVIYRIFRYNSSKKCEIFSCIGPDLCYCTAKYKNKTRGAEFYEIS